MNNMLAEYCRYGIEKLYLPIDPNPSVQICEPDCYPTSTTQKSNLINMELIEDRNVGS